MFSGADGEKFLKYQAFVEIPSSKIKVCLQIGVNISKDVVLVIVVNSFFLSIFVGLFKLFHELQFSMLIGQIVLQ